MKQILILFFVLMSFALLSLSTGAATYMAVEFVEEDLDLPHISYVQVFEDHLYYTDYFYSGFPFETPFELIAYTADEEIVESQVVYSPRMVFNYSEDITSLVLRNSSTVIDRISVSFCNFNGVCEPCLDNQSCVFGENTASCSDCPSGVRDNYCDLRDDGNCDPDCNGIDADCPSCNPCYYDYYSRERTLCEEDLRGTPCLAGEGCLNGSFVYSDDYGTLCCTGECLNRSRTQDVLSNVTDQNRLQPNQTSEQATDDQQQIESDRLSPFLWIALGVAILGIFGVLVHQWLSKRKSVSPDALQDQIVALRLRGYSDLQIKESLLRQGYSPQDISRYLQ